MGWNNDYQIVGEYCRSLGIPFHLEQTNIGRIVYEERKESNPCSLCANMRRGAINNTAKQLGCNKVALGHHLDDALETFLMSLVFEGRMHTFAPRTYLTRADITVIRPMIYVYEKDIISIANKLELPVVPNNCPADGITKRHSMKEEMARFETMNATVKERMLNADYHFYHGPRSCCRKKNKSCLLSKKQLQCETKTQAKECPHNHQT